MKTMKNLNLKSLLLLLAVLASFVACNKSAGEKSQAQSVIEPISEQEAPKEVAISVTLPDGWTKVEGSVLEHQYGKGTASFMIKNEYVLNGKGLDEAAVEAKGEIGKYFDNAEFSDIETIRVGGQDARSFTLTYAVKAAGMNMSMKMQGVYVMLNSKCYLISFGDMESSFDALAADFEQLLNGIQFEN
jgi:hypothetical protein